MADYIYLLENRLSPAQRSALHLVREVARSRNLTVFLVGGAVRDLTSGSPVRDLDVVVVGNSLKLKKELEKAGAVLEGESEAGQALFVRFPGAVRMEVGSTLSVTFPKPGKAVMKPASLLEDLRRRDFTANAMALSLNEGSYGLLMDPLNGVADIENRQLRLVSNYGFIEDPVRMIRAARLMARLGWTLDEKTQARYETGKQEGYISALSAYHRGYEAEEIVHEEDPLRVLRRLEAEGWMKHLAPFWTAAKVNVPELERLREAQTQLQMQGIYPDPAAANFPLLTAKLSPKESATLKESFPRQGFVNEIDALEADAKELTTQLGGKGAALASQAWKILTAARPEAVLQVAFSSRSPGVQAKFKSFYTEWPQARQKMPYTLMQEMRIVPELAGYDDLLEKLFFELMDGKLSTPEEMRAFLEPYSPPAPPPPVSLRRLRAAKKDAKPAKSRSKKAKAAEGSDFVASDGEPVAETRVAGAPAKTEVPDRPARQLEVKAGTGNQAPAKSSSKDGVTPPVQQKSVIGKAASKKSDPEKTESRKPAEKTVAPAGKLPATAPVKTAPAPSAAKKPLQGKHASAKPPARKIAASTSNRAKVAPPKANVVKAAPLKAGVKKVAAPAKKIALATSRTAPKKAATVVAKKVVSKKVSAKSVPAKGAQRR